MTEYGGILKCNVSHNLPVMKTTGNDLSIEVLEGLSLKYHHFIRGQLPS